MTTVQASDTLGYIGEIPVRNLWLLMLYASQLFRQINDLQKREVEDNPDDIPDLVAEILGAGCRTPLEAQSELWLPTSASYPQQGARQN